MDLCKGLASRDVRGVGVLLFSRVGDLLVIGGLVVGEGLVVWFPIVWVVVFYMDFDNVMCFGVSGLLLLLCFGGDVCK